VATWIFEPGHTEAEFVARHMMVTWVRGFFKDIHGQMELDWDRWEDTAFEGEIDARKLWTGQPERDAHLRSADFFDVERHPAITFTGRLRKRTGATHFQAATDLTIRGKTQPVIIDVGFQGEWETPFWVGDENRGTMRRRGFTGHTRINRHDFGVSWQDQLPGGGVVVSDDISLTLDVEAILLDDLERTGAIELYPEAKEIRSAIGTGSPETPG
jgi:polyisoprenoid-binding protein YceI